jgi:hypothetical protein
MTRDSVHRNHSRPGDRRARPRYDRLDELRAEALTLLAARMAYAARRGDVLSWSLYRAWAEVVLSWAVDQ